MLKQDFIREAKLLLQDEYEDFEAALDNEPPISIRINPWKIGIIPSSILNSQPHTPYPIKSKIFSSFFSYFIKNYYLCTPKTKE